MKFSKYQQDIFRSVITTKSNIAVNATAGAGKSTTLVEAAKLIPYGKSSIFVAFGKSIVEELKTKLPSTTECSTMHSIGFKAIVNYYYLGKVILKENKQIGFIMPYFEQKNNRERWGAIYAVDKLITLARATMAKVSKEGMEQVINNYALDIEEDQIEKAVQILEDIYKYNDSAFRTNIEIDFQDMVSMSVRNEKMRLPQYDYVFVDEVQDLSSLDHLFISKLKKPITGRMIGVGDPHQCQPKWTRVTMANGFTKDISEIKKGDKILQYGRKGQVSIQTKGGRAIYTEQTVLETNKRKVNEKLIQIRLINGDRSIYTTNHKIILTNKKRSWVNKIEAQDVLQSMCKGLDQMITVQLGNENWENEIRGIESIELLDYKGYVYSLKVSGNETYIADYIVTSNSIYGFRGSAPDSFDKFANQTNTITLPLSISYRCSKAIVREAKKLYDDIEPYIENQEGVVRNGTVNEIQEGNFVLCRNTRPLIDVFFQLLDQGKKAYVVGKEMEKGLLSLLSSCDPSDEREVALGKLDALKEKVLLNLKSKGVTNPQNHPKIEILSEKLDILCVLFNKFANTYEVEQFIKTVFDDENRRGVKLMTIHKSKGMECDTVFIIETYGGKKLIPSSYAVTKAQLIQERNLQFVSISRAKKELVYLNL